MPEKNRCAWCLKDQLYKDYHDEVWGRAEHDDIRLFEMFNLEGAQAGLSWYTVLVKKENYRKAFADWDARKIINFDEEKVEELMKNTGIIRNRLKINAVINNAKRYIEVQEEFGSFDTYIWSFVNNQPIVNNWLTLDQIPSKTDLSDKMSKDLKKRGFKFIGSTICYAFMQAIGMVDDHVADCWVRNI